MKSRVTSVPEGFELIETAQGTLIRRKWFSWAVIPLLLFAAMWDSFLIFWYGAALMSDGKAPWIMILFPLGHVAVGVGLTYFVICSFFNQTDILITSDEVSVITHPLPWPGSKKVAARDIHDLKVRHRVANRNRSQYALMYVDGTNHERKFLGSISHHEQALFIEDKIRETLNLAQRENLTA